MNYMKLLSATWHIGLQLELTLGPFRSIFLSFCFLAKCKTKIKIDGDASSVGPVIVTEVEGALAIQHIAASAPHSLPFLLQRTKPALLAL